MNRSTAELVQGSLLTAILLILAGLFALRQWRDRRRRPNDLPEADTRFFARQDRRRWGGSLLMVVAAFGMLIGLATDPRGGRDARQLWAASWVGVLALIGVLLLLAVIDWVATRGYALRHRAALARERSAIADEVRRAADRPTPQPPAAPNGPI